MNISIFPNGISVEKSRVSVFVPSSGLGVTGVKRGKISAFSFSSRLRLRLALLSLYIPNFNRYAITLTLPWLVDDWASCMSDFKQVLHRFRVYWLRCFPRCACVYRVELQKRGAPHLHIVSFHPSGDGLSDKYFLLWFKALNGLRGGSYSDFARRGVKVDLVPNISGVIRYLCDHSSKSKQAQLGYMGKQWGIIGRSNLSSYLPDRVSLSDQQMILFLRFLRKVTRFRLARSSRYPSGLPCVFGSKLVGGRSSCRVSYVSENCIKKFLSFLSVPVDSPKNI